MFSKQLRTANVTRAAHAHTHTYTIWVQTQHYYYELCNRHRTCEFVEQPDVTSCRVCGTYLFKL